MDIRIVIPARARSSRFPDKPLADIAGTPMVVRTYNQCLKAAPASAVTVATDDERVFNLIRSVGGDVVMTSADCLTGTDRVADTARQRPAEFYINVQGDEPIFDPDDIRRMIEVGNAYPDRVTVGYTEMSDEAGYLDRSTVKVVAGPDGRLLYMSRSPIPGNKHGSMSKAWRQICAYGLPPRWLAAYAARTAKTPLEEIEDVEILRFLEMGAEVYCIPMSDRSISVDHPEDVAKVVAALNTGRV